MSPNPQWEHVETNIFVIDLIALVSFWVIALKTQRFWPYWITGWQLIAVFGHLQKLMFAEILPRPYALLSMYISYPILFVILYAAGSTRRTRSEEHTSELQSLMSNSYAVFCLKTNNHHEIPKKSE